MNIPGCGCRDCVSRRLTGYCKKTTPLGSWLRRYMEQANRIRTRVVDGNA